MVIITNMTWQQFDDACRQIAKHVPKTITDIYGEPRGGLIVAIRLSHLLDKPLTLDWDKITSTTLVCDDITDSGATLQHLKKARKGCAFTIATLVYNKKSSIVPDIWVYEKVDIWCVFPWEKRLEE